jgi:purine-nucleoside phosphorylase
MTSLRHVFDCPFGGIPFVMSSSKSITVVMENVFHQDEGKFKEVLNEIRTAKVEYESAQFLMNH